MSQEVPQEDWFYGLDRNGGYASDAPRISLKAFPTDIDGANFTRLSKTPLPLLFARKRHLQAGGDQPHHLVDIMGMKEVLQTVRSELATTINRMTFQDIFARQGNYVSHLLQEALNANDLKV